MPFMAMCDLWDWKYYDVKLYGDVVLRIRRVKIVEWSPFREKLVIFWLCTMIVENLRCKFEKCWREYGSFVRVQFLPFAWIMFHKCVCDWIEVLM